MKKIIFLVIALMMISVMPLVLGAGTGGELGGTIGVEEFSPMVFQCGNRVLLDDDVQPWRVSSGSGGICRDGANRLINATDETTCEANGICIASYYNETECIAAMPTTAWVNGVCTVPILTNKADCNTYQNNWTLNKWSPSLIERNQQYLFEGERYQVDILVFDKNKIQDDNVELLLDGEERCFFGCVNGTCVPDCQQFEDKTINCVPINIQDITPCNARIDEEPAMTIFDIKTMSAYTCSVDILDSEHMYGLYWLKARAESGYSGEYGEYAEIARWFINPIISLSVDGDLDFTNIRPGTYSYNELPVLLENTAEGGVLLDMFITGKNWGAVADANGELGRCWDGGQYVNYLPLTAFRYYSENGAFSTRDDLENDNNDYDSTVIRNKDAEGYINIQRQLNAGFEEAMFDEAEIIQAKDNSIDIVNNGAVPCTSKQCIYPSNILYPGSAGMSLTFRLNLPEPCYGEYDAGTNGGFFFWAEAI